MLKARQRLDKYRVVRRLAKGGFAEVYEAQDTVEGIRVALKVPHRHLVTKATLEDFRREVRLTARLDHPGIVPVKTAGFIDGHFVIVQPLGDRTLAERMERAVALRTALDWSQQLLEALSYAHQERVIHCDVKPDNLLLFNDRLRLTDFGISKVAQRTLAAGGTGTVGYIAPEQAMGKPSLRSDVFSAGLVIWRLLTRRLPEWPYRAPLPGADRLRRLHPELAALLERTLSVNERQRPRDATALLMAFRKLRPRILGDDSRRKTLRQRNGSQAPGKRADWKAIRHTQFRRDFGKTLGPFGECGRCHGPVSEAMTTCPWCGNDRKRHRGAVDCPAQCPRCRRGVKLDWPSCAWCHGAAIGPLSTRSFTDRRYTGHCAHCRGDLMPFSRYCPWCRRKVQRRWLLTGSKAKCPRCSWGVAGGFWAHCAWCGRDLEARRTRGR